MTQQKVQEMSQQKECLSKREPFKQPDSALEDELSLMAHNMSKMCLAINSLTIKKV